jgi:uncharacterized protein DUF4926
VFHQFDVVFIRHDIPESGISAGTAATILDVYKSPKLAYEVEIADEYGRTLFTGAIEAEMLSDVRHSSAVEPSAVAQVDARATPEERLSG